MNWCTRWKNNVLKISLDCIKLYELKIDLFLKVYLKSRLNCLLFYDKAKCDISTDVDVLPIEDNKFILERAVEDDQDDIWTKMPQASDEENDDGMVKKTSRIRKRKLMTKMKQIHGEEEVTDSHLRGISIKKRGLYKGTSI